jgi:CheY-like chemotaxis protein
MEGVAILIDCLEASSGSAYFQETRLNGHGEVLENIPRYRLLRSHMNLPTALNRTDGRQSRPRLNIRWGTQPIPILMVDDDVSLCRVMHAVLEREGFELATEHTVASGLRRVVEDRFAIILLDVILPDGNGSIALSEFRALSRLPVIMMTGTGDNGIREACLAGGAAGYLTKPFLIRDLLTVIRRYVGDEMNTGIREAL